MLNSDMKSFSCPVCNKFYKSSGTLKTHLLIHSGEKLHECNFCNKRFTQKGTLVKHEQTHTGERLFKCGECSRSFNRRERLAEHFCTHLDLRLKCELCEKTFCSKKKLTRHLVLHSAEKPFKCNLCDSSFVCASYLHSHRSKVHNVKNVIYQCDCCRKLCKSKRALVVHKKCHSDERPYVCHLCPRTFKYDNGFKLHLRQHECAKPYVCQLCLKAFSSYSTLYQHNRIHLGIKEFQCEQCGKHFQRQHHLHRHSISHSDEKRYSCKFCGKKFKYANGLKVHTRMHTGSRPYACDLCGWRFSQSSRMKSHRLTHTGEKPFKCVACDKAFCRHDKLTDHCRRMHKQLNLTATSVHVTKTEEEQDGGVGQTVNNVCGLFETQEHLTDDAVPKSTSSSGVVVMSIENGTNKREDHGAESPAAKVASILEDSNRYFMNRVVNNVTAAAEPLCTRSGRSYGRSVNRLEFVKHSVSDLKTSLVKDDIVGSKICSKMFQEKAGHEDLTEIVEIIDITPIDSVGESNFTNRKASYEEMEEKRSIVYDSDESDLTDNYSSQLENVTTVASNCRCEISEAGGAEDHLKSSTDDTSELRSSQNPNDIVCVLPSNCSFQNDDEDFAFAMRVFGLLKTLPSDRHKNSLKVKIERMLAHDADAL